MSNQGGSDSPNNLNDRILALRLSSDPLTGQLVYLPIRAGDVSQSPDSSSTLVRTERRLNANGESVSSTGPAPPTSTTTGTTGAIPGQPLPPSSLSNSTTQTAIDIRPLTPNGSNPIPGSNSNVISTSASNTLGINSMDDDDENDPNSAAAEGMIEQTANNLIQLLFGVSPYSSSSGGPGGDQSHGAGETSSSHGNQENIRNLIGRPALFGTFGTPLISRGITSGTGSALQRTLRPQSNNGSGGQESPEFVDKTFLPSTYSTSCGIVSSKLSNDGLRNHIIRCLKDRTYLNSTA